MTLGQFIKGGLMAVALLAVSLVVGLVLIVAALEARAQWLTWRLRQPVEVQVVDEAGRPAVGAEVSAVYLSVVDASGPMCLADPLGSERAGADGRVRFRGLDLDHHSVHGNWEVWLSVGAPGASPAVLRWRGERVVTGGAHDVAGRVALPADCPPGGLEAVASPLRPFRGHCEYFHLLEPVPAVRAALTAEGRFQLEGLRDQDYTLEVHACGLTLERELAPETREVEMVAPARP